MSRKAHWAKKEFENDPIWQERIRWTIEVLEKRKKLEKKCEISLKRLLNTIYGNDEKKDKESKDWAWDIAANRG